MFHTIEGMFPKQTSGLAALDGEITLVRRGCIFARPGSRPVGVEQIQDMT